MIIEGLAGLGVSSIIVGTAFIIHRICDFVTECNWYDHRLNTLREEFSKIDAKVFSHENRLYKLEQPKEKK